MNLSKVLQLRFWEKWKLNKSVESINDAKARMIYAVNHKEHSQFGCPHCGYRSGASSMSGMGGAIWRCGECEKTSVILGDGIKKSPFGLGGGKDKAIYPKLKKHPRQGIPSHGNADKRPKSGGEYFRSRGIGIDFCRCFVCPPSEAGAEDMDMMKNISAFVSYKTAGERVVTMFGYGARLDYRDNEPDRVQVKVGACKTHFKNLESLDATVDHWGIVTQDIIDNARKYKPPVPVEWKWYKGMELPPSVIVLKDQGVYVNRLGETVQVALKYPGTTYPFEKIDENDPIRFMHDGRYIEKCGPVSALDLIEEI